MATRATGSATRRRFFRTVAGTISAALVVRRFGACADDPAAGQYVDVHTHLGQTWNTTQPLSAEELLRWMAFPTVGPLCRSPGRTEVMESAR